ncbi:MAG: beta-N-acetylhexosaminidase [Firmicutes bacterium]|nr:beta-N-acetylhexosaminidase [Bacillota bacterium]
MIHFTPKTFTHNQTAEILAELNIAAAPDGLNLIAILDESVGGLDITQEKNTVTVRYDKPVYLYRALGLISEQREPEFHISESARFNTNGVMVDCSRNAVPRPETLRKLIRILALMGMDTLMLYTEDTYELPDEPYFGYMRGRYTQEELRSLDEYAMGFGVELVPCIQTLAHVNAALQWPVYHPITDIGDILLVDAPATYALIEKMISACRSAFNSRRIHVGMDEAQLLGRGKYYELHGDSDRFALMSRHLNEVVALCQKYNFEPMIWSDMFFRLANHGEYTCDSPIPPSAVKSIPKDVALVYWDYYQDEAAIYDRMLKAHLALPCPTIFTGGAWKWRGYLPLLQMSIRRTKMALASCVENGVRDVFTTAWGDNGADAGLFSILPVLQTQAELGFRDELSDTELSQRLKTCTGIELADFLQLDAASLFPEQGDFSDPHKGLLFQDVLLGLLDHHIPKDTVARYGEWSERLSSIVQTSGAYRYLFETAEALTQVLILKAELGVKIKSAYDSGDKAYLKKVAEEILPQLITRVETFRDRMETQWMEENKPFGFEVQDIRLGGLIQRLKTAAKRLREYLCGDLSCIPELDETRLPFGDAELGLPVSINHWSRTASASII